MRVLVHADDLGMSLAVNEAIFTAYKAGLIDSASVLTTGPACAAALAARPAGLDLGVHLDLTEFPALTGAPALASLRADLAGSPAAARARLEAFVRAEPGLVRAEWLAQIEALRSAGVAPSHLDSHHHVHVFPAFWPVLREVLAASGLRGVRGVAGWRPDVGPLRQLAQAARAARFRRAFRQFRVPPAFASATVARARLGAGGLGPGPVEVMVHPGNPHSPRYAEELTWLASSPWPAEAVRVSWADWLASG